MGLFKAMKRENIDICVTTVGDEYHEENISDGVHASEVLIGFSHAATAEMMMVRRIVRIPELRRLT